MSDGRIAEKRGRAGDWSARLRLAADDGYILLSDAGNHRVLLLNERLETLSVIGDGIAGAGENRFDSPAGVAIANGRAVVADKGNQRIVKLLIRE